MKYNKNWISLADQISQLQSRGLNIGDVEKATKMLSNISYYRLAGYWWPMQMDKNEHIFKPKSTFENVLAIYNFDKELRILLFSCIETIEIAFRTKLTYYLSEEINPWWFEEKQWFKNEVEHTETLLAIDKELKRTKEVFIKEHYKKYDTDCHRPPAWKTLEVASLGNLSKLYGNLKPSVKAKDIIAKEFGLVNHTFLPSWMQDINQLRNMCAHHARLWNKNLPGRPKLLPKPPYPWLVDVPTVNQHQNLYIHLCVVKYLLDRVIENNTMSCDLNKLLMQYPNIDSFALGLMPNWQQEPLWLS